MNSVPAVTNSSTVAAVAPNAPTGLTATASGTDTINLSWTAPVDNGGRVITGYKIEVSIDSGTTWTDLVADTASTTTTYEHTGLAASTRRDYRVSAINSIGTGTTPSDVVDATTGTAANNAPVVATAIPDQTATVGAVFSYAFPTNTFTDADSGDTLIYTATKGDGTNLPTWLGFTPATRAFTGTPAATDVETVSVKVTANDSNGGLISDVFDIVVSADPVAHCDTTDTNELWCAALTVGQSGTDLGYIAGTYGSLTPATFTYRTATVEVYSLGYSVGAEFWLSIILDSGTTPPDGLLGTRDFTLEIGTGADKKTVSIMGPFIAGTFTNPGLSWSVNDTVPVKLLLVPNNVPTVTNAIPDQTATEGEAFSYQFPANTFNDTDTGDTLTYEVTQADDTDLPTWLTYTASSRRFTGTPTASDVETVSVKVTASDGKGGSVSNEFDIVVRAATAAHCNPSDPNELFCGTLTVEAGTLSGDNFFGYRPGSNLSWGDLTPTDFTWRTASVYVSALLYVVGGDFSLGILKASGTTPSDGLLGASNFVLEIGTGASKKTFAINNPGTTLSFNFSNHGLSWSDNDMVRVKLLRLKPFSEKGPELDAPSGTEGWLQVRWGERAGATEDVQAYNVEWRTVVREDEAYGFSGWTSLPGNTTCTTSNPAPNTRSGYAS